jgi:hypothetical protein
MKAVIAETFDKHLDNHPTLVLSHPPSVRLDLLTQPYATNASHNKPNPNSILRRSIKIPHPSTTRTVPPPTYYDFYSLVSRRPESSESSGISESSGNSNFRTFLIGVLNFPQVPEVLRPHVVRLPNLVNFNPKVPTSLRDSPTSSPICPILRTPSLVGKAH